MKHRSSSPLCRRLVLPLSICGVLTSAGVLKAVDFIRGDANNDGIVTIADAQRMLRFMFWEGKEIITCGDALDVNNDSSPDVADVIALLRYLGLAAAPPAAPFPEPGPDDRFEAGLDDRFPCNSYGGEDPLDDPSARLQVVDAIAAGGTDPRVSVQIATNHSMRVAGYQAVLDIGGIFEERNGCGSFPLDGLTDLSGALQGGFLSICPDAPGGKYRITFLSTITGNVAIPPRDGLPVLEIQFCLRPGIPAGNYPLTLESGELAESESGRRIVPTLVSGELSVLEDVVASECVLDPPRSGQERLLDITFKLEDSSGFPGSEVVVPLSIKTSDHAVTTGLSFSVDFDEEILQLAGIETVLPKPDGMPWTREWSFTDNQNQIPGSAGIDEGFTTGIYDYIGWNSSDLTFPMNEIFTALAFRFRIAPNAPAGTTEVRFVDGGNFCHEFSHGGKSWTSCFDLNNAIKSGQTDILPDLVNSFLFVNGKVNIIGEVTTFIRGDTNADMAVEISDAVFTLEYLFLGGPAPACPDAADANDDGLLDVSDPVATLGSLFLGAGQLPPPAGAPGGDPTPDDLRCFSVSG